MLALVFNLSNISCDIEVCGEEWLDTNILNCVDKNGELVELPLTSDFCTYKLNFYQKERYCIITVDLKIKRKHNINLLSLGGLLVKCTENIGMNSPDQDYKIGQKSGGFLHFFDFTCDVRNENIFTSYTFEVFTESWKQARKYHKKHVDFRAWCFCIGKRNKSKPITQSRKALGTKGDKIKTTMFKLILNLGFGDRRNNTEDIKVAVGSMPFRFNKNADGTLVLEKEVKSHRCMKSATA
ncbi:hypothetical protein CDIK_1790 [Cucumispora dikerogammari]|nr:hypothetical protein CDIK_1790 [Cucumispora dikerogammari]